jgi:hypothetical protein
LVPSSLKFLSRSVFLSAAGRRLLQRKCHRKLSIESEV